MIQTWIKVAFGVTSFIFLYHYKLVSFKSDQSSYDVRTLSGFWYIHTNASKPLLYMVIYTHSDSILKGVDTFWRNKRREMNAIAYLLQSKLFPQTKNLKNETNLLKTFFFAVSCFTSHHSTLISRDEMLSGRSIKAFKRNQKEEETREMLCVWLLRTPRPHRYVRVFRGFFSLFCWLSFHIRIE